VKKVGGDDWVATARKRAAAVRWMRPIGCPDLVYHRSDWLVSV
jgi:hypothetical protein